MDGPTDQTVPLQGAQRLREHLLAHPLQPSAQPRVPHIGKVLGDVCLSPGPDVIVVGGELVDAGPALLEPIERELNAKVMRGSWPPLRVRPAGLGHAATALDAIALLQRQSPVPPRYSVDRTRMAAPR